VQSAKPLRLQLLRLESQIALDVHLVHRAVK
jgi:hypothetical protein